LGVLVEGEVEIRGEEYDGGIIGKMIKMILVVVFKEGRG
jgi:hypothetical protein